MGCLFSCALRGLSVSWIQVLYQIPALQISSPSLWLVFTLLTMSFEELKFYILIKSDLSL